MGVPVTTGSLKTTLASMVIGDYMVCNYSAASGAYGSFSNFGGTAGAEIPVAGSATPDGTFYFIKVDRGLLIADRNVQHSISWDTLNSAGAIQSLLYNNGNIRLLTGGIAYADANGNKSLSGTSATTYGAFPMNIEWDKYITLSSLNGKITASDDAVWHWSGISSWTQDSPDYGEMNSSAVRVYRGNQYAKTFSYDLSNKVLATIGFRPVYEYIE